MRGYIIKNKKDFLFAIKCEPLATWNKSLRKILTKDWVNLYEKYKRFSVKNLFGFQEIKPFVLCFNDKYEAFILKIEDIENDKIKILNYK